LNVSRLNALTSIPFHGRGFGGISANSAEDFTSQGAGPDEIDRERNNYSPVEEIY
jgi:hypothetical protein